ncbi:MAG TPA: prepilin-type N-terminal cleavage/methylation domain-containing protein [Patescibacteria group bacterium]|jgi:prepilin-type N-terminal cleavage/methylation domain-containing protein|nr:prepilin-type N-terminal cleavage/methylation domain-containing protein [Patescibacteria group bacterium]
MIQTNKKGFTIIEVVLVLAIAGLIFLVVFLALPALQKSQRDTQRKADLSRMMSQISSWTSNHQGLLPSSWTAASPFFTTYMLNGNETFSDPTTGTTYVPSTTAPTLGTAPAFASAIGNVNIYVGFTCSPTDASGVQTGSGRNVAVLMQLEKGFICQSN